MYVDCHTRSLSALACRSGRAEPSTCTRIGVVGSVSAPATLASSLAHRAGSLLTIFFEVFVVAYFLRGSSALLVFALIPLWFSL